MIVVNKKKADNKIINKNDSIFIIDSEIDNYKKDLNSLDIIKSDMISLKNSVDKCVELLQLSAKGKNFEKRLSSISNNNAVNLKLVTQKIDDQRIEIENSIKYLKNKKEELDKEEKD